jgi:hypothetical protein
VKVLCCISDLSIKVRQGRMRKTSIGLQELRRKIYSKVKTDSVGSGGVGKIFMLSLSESNSRPIGV